MNTGGNEMSTDVGLRPSSSPALRAARRVRSQFRFSFDGQDGDIVRIPPGNATRLVQQLANTVTSRVLQIVPLTAHSRAAGAFSDTVWRSLAGDSGTDVEVQRLYLVPPGGTPPEPDQQAGRFQVRSASVREFIRAEPGEMPDANLWLIDDSVVVSEEPDEFPHWQVSARLSDVRRFREMWQQLWDRRDEGLAQPDSFAEPLARSADMMATTAKMSCDGHMYTEGTCSWYHGVWQHLRLFDLVSSPSWHAAFYREALSSALRHRASVGATQGRPRVLLTGTADYSMLAYVLNSAVLAQIPVDVRVMDVCRTPLIACQWYARLRGVQVVTDPDASPDAAAGPGDRSRISVCEMDVREAQDPAGRTALGSEYDVITTDAFLTRFEPDESGRIVAAWRNLLAPGGVVVTTVRVHSLDAARGGILDEVSDFVLRARDRAARWRPYMQTRLDELTVAARKYATQMRSYDLGDPAEIRDLFDTGGFDVEDAQQPARVNGE